MTNLIKVKDGGKIKQQVKVKDTIIRMIVLLSEEKVILDVHLAEMYGVETRVLKQAVRRNIERFPEDFMFELTEDEIRSVVSQNVIPHKIPGWPQSHLPLLKLVWQCCPAC